MIANTGLKGTVADAMRVGIVVCDVNATAFSRSVTAQFVVVANQGNLTLKPTFFIFANGFEDATP